MGAPWHIDDANGYAHIDTVAQNGLFGVMLTTWHRMDYRTPNILNFARYFGCAMATWSSISDTQFEFATLLRKLTWETVTYEETGYLKNQITLGTERNI